MNPLLNPVRPTQPSHCGSRIIFAESTYAAEATPAARPTRCASIGVSTQTAVDCQNQVQKGGVFFSTEKVVPKSPCSPRKKPQTHHKNTTIWTPFSQKPLQKRHSTTAKL